MIALLMWFAGTLVPGLDFELPGRVLAVIALVAVGLVLGVTAFFQFGRARTTVNPLTPEASNVLVTHGVYRWTRNPMYLGMLIVLAAWALVVSNGAAFLLLPVFIAYLNRFQIGPEEAALRARFGSRFHNYCQKVRRWL